MNQIKHFRVVLSADEIMFLFIDRVYLIRMMAWAAVIYSTCYIYLTKNLPLVTET